MSEVRVRFAPSPTGFVHIGSLRTALYNYLFAKKMGGKYILRVEDTDRTRLVDGAIENMLNAMKWAGVNHDEGVMLDDNGNVVQKGEYGPYIQSERLDIYKKYIQELLDNGKAYYCFCTKERLDEVREKQKEAGETPRYDGHCRDLTQEEIDAKIAAGEPYVIRLRLPENHVIKFTDLVRGETEFNTNDLDGQVLIKTDGFPTYHFAVVVDDHLMKITHVIRGEEWVSSTPKHVYLYEAFGWEAPKFVHLPNILNKEKKKFMKKMKSLLLMALALLPASKTLAQTNAQVFYDFGSDRKFVTLTLEMFKQDKWGSTYFFVDHDFNYDKMDTNSPNVAQGGTYTEISRALNFWQNTKLKNLSLHVEYNGGIYKDYPINNAWLFGVEYFMHDKSFKNTLTLQALYKTIRKTDQNVPMQFTAVWGCKDIFGLKGLNFSGFADFWWEDHSSFKDKDGNLKLNKDGNIDYKTEHTVFTTEPQLWYNVGQHFGCENLSVGSEVEISHNFGSNAGWMVRPCLGVKWDF